MDDPSSKIKLISVVGWESLGNCIDTEQPRQQAWLSVLMPLHVQSQVIGAREAAVAHGALEGFSPGVLPVVARQFVWARKSPIAALPRALVRFFTWNQTEGRETSAVHLLKRAGVRLTRVTPLFNLKETTTEKNLVFPNSQACSAGPKWTAPLFILSFLLRNSAN